MKFFPMGRSWILVPTPHGKELDSGCIIECDLLVVYGVCVTQKTLIYEEKKLWSDQKQNHHTHPPATWEGNQHTCLLVSTGCSFRMPFHLMQQFYR